MTELYEIKDAINEAQVDARDCERALDSAMNEINNITSSLEQALDVLQDYESDSGDDTRLLQVAEEKVRELENKVWELTEKNGRLSDSLEDIGVIVADELTA
jgi:chromosome segregation ATPase